MALQKIMVIRHAEKPVPDASGGVRASGKADASSLTALGWQRAGALVQFFEHLSPPRAGVAKPDHLFATRFDKYAADASRRPLQTLEPLSRSMGLQVGDGFGKGQEHKLVGAILKLTGVVLVAWSHENIRFIVESIQPSGAQAPEWPDDRFDLVWIFDRSPRGWKFSQATQLLLAGDTKELA